MDDGKYGWFNLEHMDPHAVIIEKEWIYRNL